MALHTAAEPHIEVHKFHAGAVAGVALLSVLVQASLPVYIQRAALVDLPLLVTLYFGLSRRNPSAGLVLGTLIGLVQDSLGHSMIGLYGIAKTLVGFGASSVGSRLDVDHPFSRFALTFAFFYFHQTVVFLIKRLLLGQHEPVFTTPMLVASVVNAALAVVLFPLLDRLRK